MVPEKGQESTSSPTIPKHDGQNYSKLTDMSVSDKINFKKYSRV